MVHKTEDQIGLVLERIEDSPCICSGCGKGHLSGVHSSGKIVVEDQPISGRRVFLYVPKRKVFCPEDGHIRTEEFDWIRKRHTKRFAEQVYRLTSITTNKEAGWFLGLDDEVVYRIDKGIDKRMLEELAEEKLEPVPVPVPKNMSVDEVAWQK